MTRSHDNDPFGPPIDGSASVMWASLVYSLVPYLGILFVPVAMGAVVWGVLGRGGAGAERGHHLLAFSFGLAVLAFQVFLWWLLYYIPEISV
ncbi:MAG: hypothetical protein AB7G18_15745 [Pyrinomonadaceae bacterium]